MGGIACGTLSVSILTVLLPGVATTKQCQGNNAPVHTFIVVLLKHIYLHLVDDVNQLMVF